MDLLTVIERPLREEEVLTENVKYLADHKDQEGG